ncbi:HNH endonuclease [Arthrobacter sp. ISL-85]|uniref:HNH endonuclease n=1 Tax=Arthrobacter sp. ISL-85 TaxID=2819115 RepID=UPI001BE98763|nr:HNH endonuclease [Arthrobacter sp. ISL-85]MBT2567302.1 HNH endonuclease [Arthrobacter sp. ISL-85]
MSNRANDFACTDCVFKRHPRPAFSFTKVKRIARKPDPYEQDELEGALDALTTPEIRATFPDDDQCSRMAEAIEEVYEGRMLPRLRRDILPRPYIPQLVKEMVWTRDGGQCVECSSTTNLQFGHVIPYSWGGSSTEANLQIECAACNQSKGANL